MTKKGRQNEEWMADERDKSSFGAQNSPLLATC